MKTKSKLLPAFLVKKVGIRNAYFYAWGAIFFVPSFIIAAIILFYFSVTNLYLIVIILIGVPVLITSIAEVMAFRKGRVIVKQNCATLVEHFGEYTGDMNKKFEEDKEGVLREGLTFLFPYLKIFKLHGGDIQYSLGRDEFELFKNGELVNFKDASVSIEARVIVKITDLRKAVYDNVDYKKTIIGVVESAIKETLEGYNLKELSEKKNEFEIFNIFSTKEEKEKNKNSQVDERQCEALDKIEKIFGIRIEEIIVPQIKYTEEEKASAAKINAEKNRQEEIKIANATKILEAENKAKIIEIETEAKAFQTTELALADGIAQSTTGLSRGQYIFNLQSKSGLTAAQVNNLLVAELIKDSKNTYFVKNIDDLLGKFCVDSVK